MMKNFTQNEKNNGELATRYLSDEAFEIYSNSDPVTVWEYCDDKTNVKYAIDFGGDYNEDLSFEELEEIILLYAEQIQNIEAVLRIYEDEE